MNSSSQLAPQPTTEAERRVSHEQALASTRTSGSQPTPEFLADVEAVIRGHMTIEEARAASLVRAKAVDVVALAAASANKPF